MSRDVDCFVIINDVLLSCVGGAEQVVVPEGVKVIGTTAFSQCEDLRQVTLPQSLRVIEKLAFLFCDKLQDIIIPPNVETIGAGSFKGCKGLADSDGFVVIRHMLHDYVGEQEHVVIPRNVRTIGFEAFRGNKKLRSVTIPEYVTAISSSAFERCSNLTLQGPAGSSAERFAKQRNIPFKTI